MEDFEFSEEELAVDELRDAGADLSARRRVDHYLYFPTRMLADPAVEELRRPGFAAEVELEERAEALERATE